MPLMRHAVGDERRGLEFPSNRIPFVVARWAPQEVIR